MRWGAMQCVGEVLTKKRRGRVWLMRACVVCMCGLGRERAEAVLVWGGERLAARFGMGKKSEGSEERGERAKQPFYYGHAVRE